jgi:hypothetical protein
MFHKSIARGFVSDNFSRDLNAARNRGIGSGQRLFSSLGLPQARDGARGHPGGRSVEREGHFE